jgi:hypothetical protein
MIVHPLQTHHAFLESSTPENNPERWHADYSILDHMFRLMIAFDPTIKI